MDIFEYLQENGVEYRRYDHEAVFTCEQARRCLPDIPAAETKNLFLRDKRGSRHFLVSIPAHKQVDLKTLSSLVNSDRLGMASAERLKTYLGVKPGSVTLLALIHDTNHNVEVVIDEEIWQASAVQCHPLVNTCTLAIDQAGMRRFFDLTGHLPSVIRVPAKSGLPS